MKLRTVILLFVLVAILGCFAFAAAQEQAAGVADAVAEGTNDEAEILTQVFAAEEEKIEQATPESVVAAEPAVEAPQQETPIPPVPLPEQVDEKDVIVLDISNFDSLVGDAKEPWLVEFYAPWCGWCKKLVPVYAELATALKGKVHVGKVDVTENIPLRNRFEIHGFPTIKFLLNGKVYNYQKERTVADFTKFVEGGYKEIENPSVLPPPPPIWKQIQDEVYIMMLPMEKWVEYHIWPFTFITFGTGIVLGMMFSIICCRSSAKPKTKQD